MRRSRERKPAPEWGRRKLLALLFAGAGGVLAAVVGLGLAVYYSVLAGPDDPTQASAVGDEAPNPAVTQLDQSVARPGPLTTKKFDAILLPTPTSLGPAGVSSGFPRTAEGALAQLAAIDQHVLQSASVSTAQVVVGAWAMPGGPTPESWSGVHAVASLLTSAGLTSDGAGRLVVSASPKLGLIRAEAGDRSVVVCVDFVVTATMTKTASIAAADCQRMVWAGGRWMIGAGPEPAQAPSVWPGTDAALHAGFKVLRDE